jgi:hypothetical protein
MATKEEEAHGSSAKTKEFSFDPAAHGVGAVGVPDRADIIISMDANQTVQADVMTPEQRWRFDVKLAIRGPTCNADVDRAFVDGSAVDESELPAWMDPLLAEIERHVEAEVR